jgi:hypothetical protein
MTSAMHCGACHQTMRNPVTLYASATGGGTELLGVFGGGCARKIRNVRAANGQRTFSPEGRDLTPRAYLTQWGKLPAPGA